MGLDNLDPENQMALQEYLKKNMQHAMRTRTHFQELDFESVRLSHPTGGDSTLLYGLKMQNVDITTDITATPLN